MQSILFGGLYRRASCVTVENKFSPGTSAFGHTRCASSLEVRQRSHSSEDFTVVLVA